MYTLAVFKIDKSLLRFYRKSQEVLSLEQSILNHKFLGYIKIRLIKYIYVFTRLFSTILLEKRAWYVINSN